MTFWRLFYHAVWATHRREPLLLEELYEPVERSIRATGRDNRCYVQAVGLMPDHAHVALSIPPNQAISTIVGRMKGSSSHLINNLDRSTAASTFAWQAEYGVLSFGEQALSDVVAYVQNQRARHAGNKTWPLLEQVQEASDRS